MTKIYSALELENFINTQESIVILHNIDGEIWGASHGAIEVFGYTQSEIRQLYLSNIKAKTLRLADVIKDDNEEKEKLIWEQRNGHRFCAFVTTELIHAMVLRQEVELFSLTLEIVNPTGRIAEITPDINILDIHKYLNSFQKEIQNPLMQLDEISEKNRISDNPHFEDIQNEVGHVKEQLQHAIQNIIDSFKLVVNDFNIARQPFNIVSKMGDYGAHWCNYSQIISLFVDKHVPELVYGDEKKLRVILDNILHEANDLFKPKHISIELTTDQQSLKTTDHITFLISLNECQILVDASIENTRHKIETFNNTSSFFLTKNLVNAMSGNINAHQKNSNSVNIEFNVLLPEVDDLGIENNREFLHEKDIYLFEPFESCLSKQLQTFSAQVHHFTNIDQFLSNLKEIDHSSQSALIIIHLPSTDRLDNAFVDKSIFECDYFKQSPTLLIKPIDYFLNNKDHILKISSPYQPASLGNMLSQIVQKNMPYPYSHQQLNRRELPHDKIANVLLVQSEPTISDEFILQLNSIGYHVETAVNGIDALLACSGWKYDALIIDNTLPLMEGIELVSHLKNNFESYKNTFIVLLLEKFNQDKQVVMQELGLTHYLTKPVAQMSLLKTMNEGITQSVNSSLEQSDVNVKPQSTHNEAINNDTHFLNNIKADTHQSEPTNDPSNSITYVDKQVIQRLISDTNIEITRQMLDLFIEESYLSLGKLEQCIELGKWQEVHVFAQEITTSSITFGCIQLHDLATRLINESKENNLSECLKITGQLSQVFLLSQNDLYSLSNK